jgi:hypothetical protein
VPPYHEPDLFRLGYAFEHVTTHRRPPACTPALWPDRRNSILG